MAATLVELLPPVGWADVATKRLLDALRFGGEDKHDDNQPDPGDTSFHERVHWGTPGQFAFKQQDNVSVVVCSEEPVTLE